MIVVMIIEQTIVMMRRHASPAGGHRIGRGRVLARERSGDACGEAVLQQPVHDVLGIVANHEAISHEIIDRRDDF